jgi:hypothetical protein
MATIHTTQQSFWGPNFGTWQPKKRQCKSYTGYFGKEVQKLPYIKLKRK